MSIRPGFPASLRAAVPVLLAGFAAGWFLRGAAAGGAAVKASPGQSGPGGGGAAAHAHGGPDPGTPPGTAVPVKTAQALLGEWRGGGIGAEEVGWRLLSLAETASAGELHGMAEWARSAGLPQELRKALFEGIGRNPAVNAELLRGILTKEALGDWQVCAGLADGLAEGGSARLEMIGGFLGEGGNRRILGSAEGLAWVRDKGFRGAMGAAAAQGLPMRPGYNNALENNRAERIFQQTLAMGAAGAREAIEVISQAKEGADSMKISFGRRLAETDPRGTLDWLATLPPEIRGGTLSGVFEGSAGKDPEYALEFLSRFSGSDDDQQNALYALQSVFSKSDPDRAAQCQSLLAELEARRKAR